MTSLLALLAYAFVAPVPQSPVVAARDESGEGRAFIERERPRDPIFVGQDVRIRVVFGVEERFRETAMVQPFGARLDVPVQVTWLGVEIAEEGGEALETFAWNEAVRSAPRIEDRVADGRTYRVHAVEAIVRPPSPGALALPRPTLAYAYATRFDEGFLDSRVPADRIDATVSAPPLEIDVSALPEAGRPDGFTGAVGRFTITASASPLALEVGESLRLLLEIRGSGNLDSFEAPRWKEIGGFRVLGCVDEKRSGLRTLALDLAPYSASVRQIPAIPFAYFDPDPPAGYRTARSEPIDVEVRRGARVPGPTPAAAPASPSSGWRGWWIVGAGAAVGLLVLVLRRR